MDKLVLKKVFGQNWFYFYFSQRCTCGQSLKYEKVMDNSCNSGCNGNTNNYAEYCGGSIYVSVYSTGNV